jgi:hypothetical protein
MIIMLNGAFGVGKTSVAAALHQRLPQSLIFDPELVGTLARYLTEGIRTGSEDTDDFQDIALWRSLSIIAARELFNHYHRSLIVPMTIAHPEYFGTIRAGFATIAPVTHFCLQAPLYTIGARLQERGDDVSGWAWRKSQQYVPLLADARFAQHVETHNRTITSMC